MNNNIKEVIIILVQNQKIELKWTRRNRQWYESKGYIFTNYSEPLIVDAQDLSKGAKYKVKVKCDYCGAIKDVVWRDYYHYSDDMYACQRCRQTKTSAKTLKERQQSLYNRALDFCNEKGYKLMCKPDDIHDAYTLVKYICPKHGEHVTKIYNIITRHACIYCKHEDVANALRHDPDFIESEFLKFGCVLLNKHEYVNSMEKNMKVLCPECGQEFITSYYAFMKHNGQRCPECTGLESHGEYNVRTYLQNHNINYIPQYRFDDCRYKNTLPFDFYLPDINTAIEFDGAQHFIPVKRGNMTQKDAEDTLKEIQVRDNIKNKYCETHNIKLIRIPYQDINNINDILDLKLQNNYSHDDIV